MNLVVLQTLLIPSNVRVVLLAMKALMRRLGANRATSKNILQGIVQFVKRVYRLVHVSPHNVFVFQPIMNVAVSVL